MAKTNIVFFIMISFLSISCSVETLNYISRIDNKSQMPSSVVSIIDNQYINDKIVSTQISIEKVKYMSDLSNLITVFPKFTNAAVDAEIKKLKTAVQSYIYATTEGKAKQKKSAYKAYAQSFKTLQSLKKYMNSDDMELMSRYLTRIKANINSLEYLN
ncbi:hypothetical protein GNY06_09035 [Elizabethkingia argentiflava]|uniref:Lipoprotein n=1 Tax=Elizabethkingia argenteiflava TaxID=2681556 RepID=A0A845PXE0_9FLAO|nr:hypothetical protein [Elizabethkingia argenteiflava]NAW51516.1 hypothetical protein [Elizabethkingia argenteiflava]